MTNFLTRLFGKKKTNAASRRSRRRDLSRNLRVERMEERQLLANDFFGAVQGNVFTDLNDNGLDVGDTGLVGASVRLYNDVNNDDALDAGDTLITTQNTDASGDYLFEGLQNGEYLVEQVAVAGTLQRTTETVKAVTVSNDAGNQAAVVDALNTITSPDPLIAAAGATSSDQQTGAVGEILGGQRDVEVINDAGSGSDLEFDIDPAGAVIIDAGVATTGDVFITYDGVDGSASTIGHALGGIDLTANDGRSFLFRVGSQVGSFLTVEVYSGDNQTASALTLELPQTAGGAATADLHFCFDDFVRLAGATADADFTNVSAIRLRANMAAADDISIDLVGIQGLAAETANFPNLNPMSLGNQVFEDTNDNGILDAGESGIQGVSVQLFEDTNGNGTFDSGTDTQVAGGTGTTDANGNYLFENLLPGNYIVVVPISEFNGTETLVGFLSSSGNDPAPDPDNDVNDDDNGTLIAGVGVASQAITLAAASEPTNDGDADNNTNLTVDFGFNPQIDLAVTKTAGASQVTAGNQLTYSINVTNSGQSTANNVIVVDDLPNLSPTDLSIVSVTSSLGGTITQPGNANGEIEVRYASLTPGQSDTITVIVQVPDTAAAATGINNVVTVDADESETDETNNRAEAAVDIVRNAVLQITKTDTPDPNSVGSALTYNITVTNTGPSVANNVVVSDSLPTGLTFGSVTTTLGTASGAGNVVTGNIPTLAVGQSATLTVNTTINTNFTGTTIPNTATAVADEATQVSASADTTVNPEIDLSIVKVDDVDPNNRGSRLVYTLTVQNNGPSEATNVRVTDTLPADVTFVSATGGTVTAPTGTGRDVLVDLGTMASGASRTVTISVDINADAPDQITNNASVTSAEANFESDTTNNSTTETTDLNPAIDLQIVKNESIDPVIAGNDLVYTMTVTNNGPSSASNVQFTDTLPAGVTFVSSTSSQGTVSNTNGTISGNLGTLASGASATVTITVGVNADATGTLTNTASVTADETETDTTNNSDSEDTTINQSVDLALTKVDNATTVSNGSSLVYTLTVTNNGPSIATGVTVTDTLPSELQFDNGTSTAGTVTNTGNAVTVDVGTMQPGATETITLNTTVIGTGFGTITNTASVAAAEAETTTANNSDSDSVELAAPALSKRRLLASTV